MQSYKVKHTHFFGRNVTIVLQNINGACPLLALANILLLRGTINIHEDFASITSEELLSHIGGAVLESSDKITQSNNGLRENQEANLMEVIQLLPRIEKGIDVNVKFKSITDFEYTSESIVFDLLGIRLVHGWLVDDQDVELASFVRNYSYNQLIEKLVQLNAPVPTAKVLFPSPLPTLHENQNNNNQSPFLRSVSSQMYALSLDGGKIDSTLSEALLAEKFLEENPTQLTYNGLIELNAGLNNNELACFFRNNHFSTILKHEGELYILVTDQGFQSVPVVWEKLCQVDGDSIFVDENFQLYQATSITDTLQLSNSPSTLHATQSTVDIDRDFALAVQLASEDSNHPPEKTTKEKKPKGKKDKDRESCAIQ